MIKDSKKPLIIAGAGILKGHAYDELKEFVDKTNIPVAMTLLGLVLSLLIMNLHLEW